MLPYTLTGGAGADQFEMTTGGGHDVITDFEISRDRIYIGEWSGIHNLADVLEFASEIDGGVLIEKEEGSLFLAGIALEDLAQRNFTLS